MTDIAPPDSIMEKILMGVDKFIRMRSVPRRLNRNKSLDLQMLQPIEAPVQTIDNRRKDRLA